MLKLLMYPQVMLAITYQVCSEFTNTLQRQPHINYCMNLVKFVTALYKNGLVYQYFCTIHFFFDRMV